MPIYVYRCADCGQQIEKRQSFSDAPLTVCESCGGSLSKLIMPAPVIFKGSGWYITDHRSNSNGGSHNGKGHSDSEATAGEKARSNGAEKSTVPESTAAPEKPAASAAKSE